MSSACFESEGSSSGRLLYMQYSTYCTACSDAWNVPYHNSTYNRLPEDEPSGTKHVEDIKNIRILFRNAAFCWFMLYNSF
jgi:hypothetical protein